MCKILTAVQPDLPVQVRELDNFDFGCGRFHELLQRQYFFVGMNCWTCLMQLRKSNPRLLSHDWAVELVQQVGGKENNSSEAALILLFQWSPEKTDFNSDGFRLLWEAEMDINEEDLRNQMHWKANLRGLSSRPFRTLRSTSSEILQHSTSNHCCSVLCSSQLPVQNVFYACGNVVQPVEFVSSASQRRQRLAAALSELSTSDPLIAFPPILICCVPRSRLPPRVRGGASEGCASPSAVPPGAAARPGAGNGDTAETGSSALAAFRQRAIAAIF